MTPAGKLVAEQMSQTPKYFHSTSWMAQRTPPVRNLLEGRYEDFAFADPAAHFPDAPGGASVPALSIYDPFRTTRLGSTGAICVVGASEQDRCASTDSDTGSLTRS